MCTFNCLECSAIFCNEGVNGVLYAFCDVCDPDHDYAIHTISAQRGEGEERGEQGEQGELPEEFRQN